MNREAATRAVGAFVSLVEDRDPAWMIHDLDAEDCLTVHLLLMEYDERLKKQYVRMGGSLDLKKPDPVAPPVPDPVATSVPEPPAAVAPVSAPPIPQEFFPREEL